VVSLGRLGIVVELVLDLEPTFQVAQTVVEGVSEPLVADQLSHLLAAAYSVSVFTDWAGRNSTRVWVKEKIGTSNEWSGEPLWGGRVADGARHPVPGMPTEHATAQMGVPGPWDERLPHFRLDHMPSSGEELQSEYFVDARHAEAVWGLLMGMHAALSPVLQISEVRAVAPESLWLSQTRGESTVAFHFTWTSDAEAVRKALAVLESNLAPFDARPHWGKVFGTSSSMLTKLYPRLNDFASLVKEIDPGGRFAMTWSTAGSASRSKAASRHRAVTGQRAALVCLDEVRKPLKARPYARPYDSSLSSSVDVHLCRGRLTAGECGLWWTGFSPLPKPGEQGIAGSSRSSVDRSDDGQEASPSAEWVLATCWRFIRGHIRHR
jgi:hypothetical protein